jgi:hypothetical protein
MKHVGWFFWLSLAVLLFSRRAGADPSDADRATARALAIEGFKALDDKDFTTAADRFSRADAIVHAPTLLLGLARADVGLGKLVAAQEVYNRLVHEPVAKNATKVFLAAVASGKTELDALTPRIAWLTVKVTGGTATDVQVDGVAIPSAAVGAPRPVDPGQHLAVATATGARAESKVTLREGQKQTITLELTPLAAAPPVAPAVVAPVVPPPAVAPPAVVAPVVVAPIPKLPPPPKEKEPQAIAQKRSTRKTVAYVSLGVGAAGLVLGAVTGAVAGTIHGSVVGSCPGGRCPADDQSKVDNYNTMGLVSTIGFIAGGAAAGLGVVLLVTSPKTPAARVGLTVAPTNGGGMLGAAGSF